MASTSSATSPSRPPTPIVILNWNGLADTIECVDSLANQSCQDFLVHLIDNGSDGDDAQQLRARYQSNLRIQVSSNPTNLGFTRGVNRALEAILAQPTLPDYVVLLNNDTLPDPQWLQALIDAATSQHAQVVGCCMVNYYRPEELDNAGHIWLDSGEILPRGTGQPVIDYQDPTQLMGVCAGAMLVSTKVLLELGLFDEFFQTGYEDAEFGLRAFIAGYPSYYEPKAVVRHKISRSVDKVRSREYAMRIALNINYTYGKLAPPLVAACNAPLIGVKTLGVLIVALLSGRWNLFSAHLTALVETWKNLPEIRKARKAASGNRRVSSLRLLRQQKFFLPRHLSYFRRYILSGKKTVFER